MPRYIRAFVPGATFFFTLVTYRRARFLTAEAARRCLREAWLEVKGERPFRLIAVCLLPDHLHTLWGLPEDDAAFDVRWSCIKREFTKRYRACGGKEAPVSESRARKREAGFWQRRFWEHRIRDNDDFSNHMDYLHYNPVKHGYVSRPADWPWSSFHHYVSRGIYWPEWGETEPATTKGMMCTGEVP